MFTKRRPRSSVLNVDPNNTERVDPPEVALCFDWGRTILEIARQDVGLRSASELGEMVKVLRRETTPTVLTAILAESRRATSEDAKRLALHRACEDFAIQSLRKTHWTPIPLKEKEYTARNLAGAKFLSGILSGGIGVATNGLQGGTLGVLLALSGVEQLSYLVESRWYLRADFETSRRLFRGKLFRQFDGSAIAPSVEDFVNRAMNSTQ